MTGAAPGWLTVRRGTAPLVVSLPHTGTEIPPDIVTRLVSPALARQDTDWWIDRLYAFASDLGATVTHTAISRTVIDVNRDPSGVSLYPGQATTGLCPVTTFDGEPLYAAGAEPDAGEIAARRLAYFEPYHAALHEEVRRLKTMHPSVVVYDCHSIRSVVPRLFEGPLPEMNLGTNAGASCAPALRQSIADLCTASGRSFVADGRFKGGFITRSLGRPASGVHAVQMELACRAYLREPLGAVTETTWPVPYDPAFAAPLAATLRAILVACLAFAARP
ncbi:N-formylglutamate deformylase [Methylobrevis albus]|uniref:N-formylglutamate deformylase n=1 Tax=Methylobrevis albus TaxID=2793297 RepID=A0A931I130_9HYPH|nr:N-formylglutamate deformylase [Methylobrevis albus]MBH0237469.1 N-formylglutamate deformylase [Methylobrevis albus]